MATVSHVCLNDDVVEGLELRDDDGDLKAFSVQYHPEAAAGPHDAAYLFDRFCELMEVTRAESSGGGVIDGCRWSGRPTCGGVECPLVDGAQRTRTRISASRTSRRWL